MRKLFIILFAVSFYSVNSQTNYAELDYYPLNTRDYFEYLSVSWQMPYPPDSLAYSIEVMGDTLLANGKQYKILHNRSIPVGKYSYFCYERIDSLTGSVFRYKKDSTFKDDEFMIDSLYAQSNDTINCSREGRGGRGFFQTICDGSSSAKMLGLETETKSFRDQSSIPLITYILAKGLGYYRSSACEFSCYSTHLVFARVKGIEYGKTITSIDETDSSIPLNYKLYQNYPNPFNPWTKITFEIPERSFIELKIYDLKGAKIKTLFKKEYLPGIYSFDFDGSLLSSGIYFYQLVTSKNLQTKKMLLIK